MRGMENYEIRRVSLSTISTLPGGYKVGILNSGDNENSNSGGSSDSKYGNFGGESDHWVSGEDGEGELVNDGIGEKRDGSSKLEKPSHEVDHGPFLVWPGVMKSESNHGSGWSGNSGPISVGVPAISK